MNSFVLGDARLCIGCQACMVACARAHEDLPAGELIARHMPFVSRLTLVKVAEVTVPVQCRQCEDSPCANACPVGAIVQKDSHIDVIGDLCVGCKSCLLACPFGAIQIVETTRNQLMLTEELGQIEGGEGAHQKSFFVVSKCDLCAGHDQPACVAICPADALSLVPATGLQGNIISKRQRAASKLGHCAIA